MCCLNHIDVVSSITDRQCRLILTVLTNETDQGSFLLGRGSVDDKALRLHEGFNYLLTPSCILLALNSLEEDGYGSSTDHQILIPSLQANVVDEGVFVDRFLVAWAELEHFTTFVEDASLVSNRLSC
jgi:hypothetical protein